MDRSEILFYGFSFLFYFVVFCLSPFLCRKDLALQQRPRYEKYVSTILGGVTMLFSGFSIVTTAISIRADIWWDEIIIAWMLHLFAFTNLTLRKLCRTLRCFHTDTSCVWVSWVAIPFCAPDLFYATPHVIPGIIYFTALRAGFLSIITAAVALQSYLKTGNGSAKELMKEFVTFIAVAGCAQLSGALLIYIRTVNGHQSKDVRQYVVLACIFAQIFAVTPILIHKHVLEPIRRHIQQEEVPSQQSLQSIVSTTRPRASENSGEAWLGPEVPSQQSPTASTAQPRASESSGDAWVWN
ncbi:hypothetical protein DM02DRAFT_635402 [Periconia macrospinosa]|uniref:Uncharacterized protein n=1 Tax=Periconia macrospinosa TaxID=97972 RepID=A0A2V1D2Y2_9PLEO|nr:hypothetical protein DM02DRAFT_635402 [Periconia macrospinosa]